MRNYSFKKEDRILKHSDFIRLKRDGKHIQNNDFIAAFYRGCFDTSRLGITVTKKIGCAVGRNRIKRVIREYFRLNQHDFADSWDINIIAKKQAAALSTKQMFSSLKGLFVMIEEKK